MKKISLLVIVFFVFSQLVTAQAPDTLWTNTYGGTLGEWVYSIQQTYDSGYVIAGMSQSTDGDVHGNHGSYDFWVVRLNQNADTLWTKTYGGSGSDWAYSIQQTFDSGYIVAGYTESIDGDVHGNHGSRDFWVVKLNVTGDTLWTRTYGGVDWDEANSVQQTLDSGFIVAGYSSSNNGDVHGNHGASDNWIIKLTNTGDTLWTKCFGGSSHDGAKSIQQTYDSGYVVTGYTYSNEGDVHGKHGMYDYWVIKLNNLGDTIWTKCLGGSNNDKAQSIQQTLDSGYIVAGYTESHDGDVDGQHGYPDYWIVKLDSNGEITWSKALGGSESDIAYSIQQTFNESFIIAGSSGSTDGDVQGNHGGGDMWIVKLYHTGNIAWAKCFGGSGSDPVRSIQQTYDSGYVVAGFTESTDGDVHGNHGGEDFWVVRLAADGISCPLPSSQSETNIGFNSVDLGWTENGDAIAWQIILDTSDFDTATATPVIVYNNPYHWTGLSESTNYDWYVQADCGGGDQSFWLGPHTFTSACNPKIAPFSDSFETQTPGYESIWTDCWTSAQSGSTNVFRWSVRNSQANSGTNCASTFSGTGEIAKLYSPFIDVSQLTTPLLTFYYYMHDETLGTLHIDVFKENNWINDEDTLVGQQQTHDSDGWFQRLIDLSAYSGDTIQICFRAEKEGSTGNMYIDDFSIEEMPSCLWPTAQTTINITSNKADLAWTENGIATTWQIMLDTTGFDTANATPITVTNNSYTWTGLADTTAYDWYVRADCGSGDQSRWTGPHIFTTHISPITTFPWLEGFEHGGNIPVGWSNEHGPNMDDWTFISGDGNGPIEKSHSGDYNAFIRNFGVNGGCNQKLVTRPLDLTGLSNPVLSFWNTQAWFESWHYIDQDILVLYYKTSDEGEWTQIPIQNYSYCPIDWIEEYCIPLPNPSDDYYLAFEIDYCAGLGICLDDVMVEDLPTCLRPSEMNEYIGGRIVNLDWQENGSATSWQIMLDTAGFDTATAVPITVTNTSYQWNGLSEYNIYDWYVRTDCNGGEFSSWAMFRTFLFQSNPFLIRNTYGGSEDDLAYSIQQTYDSGFIIAGSASSYDFDVLGNHGGGDFWIVKINEKGDTTWTSTLGGSSNDEAQSIQQTFDSGYIVAGYSSSNDGDVHGNHGGSDFWVIKQQTNGDTIWTKTYGGSNSELAYSIQQTYDSGYIVAGYTHSNDKDVHGNHGGDDFWIVKLTNLGDTLWTKTLGGSGYERASSIQQTYDSGYIVAGYTHSNDKDVHGNHGGDDFWIVKLTNLGDTLWAKTLGGTGYERASSIQQTYDSSYVVAGYTSSTDGDVHGNHGEYDYWVVKMNILGDTLWTKTYGGSADDRAQSVQQTTDSGFVIAGYSYSNDGDVFGNKGNEDYWIVKLNSFGDTLWTKTMGGSRSDIAQSIQQTNSGSFMIAGWTDSDDGDVLSLHELNHNLHSDYWVVELAEFPNHIYQDIPLSNGWNILSFNVTPNDLNLQNILQPLIDSSELIKVIDEAGGIIQNIPGIGWMNTIGNMANTEGYYTKVNTNTQLQTTGLPVALPYTIPLTTGWNIMGYPLQQSQDALTAVQSLIDDDELIKVLDEAGGFIQDIPGIGWMNTIGDFEAGEGYYIKVTDNTSLTLDNPPILFIGSPSTVQKQPQLFGVPKANPYLPMNIIVTGIDIEGYSIQDGDEIAVFDNNRLVGAGVITTGNKAFTSFATTMDDPTTTAIDGYIEGNIPGFQFKSTNLTGSIQLTVKPVFGDLRFSPLGTLVCTLEGSLTAVEQKKEKTFYLKCIPNPANNYTTIQYQLPEEGQLQLEVYDLSSHHIKTLQNEQQSAGSHTYRFDATLLERGIYLIKIQLRTNDNQYIEVVKFVRN